MNSSKSVRQVMAGMIDECIVAVERVLKTFDWGLTVSNLLTIDTARVTILTDLTG